ncbi:MAG: hypothetical protein WC408_06975 [Candidatus Micrarchaeia archaeon]|jgi:hypothetical protein
MDFLVFGLLNEIFFWGDIAWLIILALVAWYLYSWAQEHLAFSPTLAIVVAIILIYYLVIVYPVVGISMWLFSAIIFSGVVWMLPMLVPFIPGLGKGGHH